MVWIVRYVGCRELDGDFKVRSFVVVFRKKW